MSPMSIPSEQPPPPWAVAAAFGIILAILIVLSVASGDDEPAPPSTGGQLVTCPETLEELGPFVRGVDQLYDPAMDWDGDGVSCE